MQITIDLPEPLAQQLAEYLKAHPQETIVSLVQEVLAVKALLQDRSLPKDTSKLLELAGLVAETTTESSSTPLSKEEKINQFFRVADQMVQLNEVAPITEAEIEAEIEAYRAGNGK